MSYVMAVPEVVAAAATDVAAIGSALSAAHIAAAAPTVGVIPAAVDEVSASVAHLFSRYAQDFHALAAQAAAFHQQFVQHLHATASSYVTAEAANAASLLHMTANAGSAAAALPSSLTSWITSLGAALSQSLSTLESIFVTLLPTLLPFLKDLLSIVLNLAVIRLYFKYLTSFVKYLVTDLLVQVVQVFLLQNPLI
jgi:hypothetical protein